MSEFVVNRSWFYRAADTEEQGESIKTGLTVSLSIANELPCFQWQTNVKCKGKPA